jgi:hypothetical protein
MEQELSRIRHTEKEILEKISKLEKILEGNRNEGDDSNTDDKMSRAPQ